MKMMSPKPFFLTLLALLAVAPLTTRAQSLWHEESSRSLVADKRAAGIGDILTVLVQENSTATKKNSTSTAKNSGMDASISSFLYSPGASSFLTQGGQMPALKYNAKNTFDGGGSIDNAQTLVASVAVRVIDVLPNHNLVIEGRRETAFGGEQQTAVLHGIVRLEDILANNTVYSYNIADAKVQIQSKGTISDSQRKGWFTRVWEKVTPF